MSFETGVFPVLVSENEAAESLSPQVRGGLNSSSATPLHVQLSDLMRVKILSEDWKAGTYIPSEAEFMAQYGVSRGTIRKAIQSLVKEGLLLTQKGRATQVISNTVRHAAGNTVLSFAAALRDGGFEYRTEVLFKQVVPADQAVAEHLEIPIGSDVLFLRRVRSVSDRPVVCQESWSNLLVCPQLEEADFENESLFDAVERTSQKEIARSRMRYQSQIAGKDHADYLQCSPNEALLVLEQVIELSDGNCIEWSQTWLAPHQSVVGVSEQVDGSMGPLDISSVRRSEHVDASPTSTEIDSDQRTQLEFDLRHEALAVRRGIIELAHRYSSTPFHIGGACSVADIVSVLLSKVMQVGHRDCEWELRDRLILSKAHTSLALFPALLRAGMISQKDIDRGVFGPDAVLFKHPLRDPQRGFEISGGSLGMGLGYAAGLGLSLHRKDLPSRVFCIVGDGECDEGSIWESAAFIGHNQLSNVTVIVDQNRMQLDGPCASILDTGSIARKFDAFGFESVEVDGHDVLALYDALKQQTSRPRAIIAHTIKGKGLSFAENNVSFHDACVTDDLYEQALSDLKVAEEACSC